MSLNAAKCQGYSLCSFWVTKGKPTGQGKFVKFSEICESIFKVLNSIFCRK